MDKIKIAIRSENEEEQTIEYELKIVEPTFEQLSFALSSLIKTSGAMNIAGAGKVILDLCCKEVPDEILNNPKVLLGVCMQLAQEYVLPANVEIKKK